MESPKSTGYQHHIEGASAESFAELIDHELHRYGDGMLARGGQ